MCIVSKLFWIFTYFIYLQGPLCTMFFISCGGLPHSAVSSAYRKFEIDLPQISAPDSVLSATLVTCSV